MKTALTALPLVACSFALVLGACSGGIDDAHEDEHGSSQAPMITTGVPTISPTVTTSVPRPSVRPPHHNISATVMLATPSLMAYNDAS